MENQNPNENPNTVANRQDDRRAATVEQMGVFFEQSGWTPLHGRVFAFLLVSNPAHQEFAAIQEFLHASKSAISTALKFLMDQKLVTYTTFPGDRKRYFKIDQQGWRRSTEEQIKSVARFADILELVLETRSGNDDDLGPYLHRMREFYLRLDAALTDFFAKNYHR